MSAAIVVCRTAVLIGDAWVFSDDRLPGRPSGLAEGLQPGLQEAEGAKGSPSKTEGAHPASGDGACAP